MKSHAIMITLKTGRNFQTELVRDTSKHVMTCEWANMSWWFGCSYYIA